MNEYLSFMISRQSEVLPHIKHENSCETAGLQLVDFVSGAVYQYYEHNNSKYIEKLNFSTKKELFFYRSKSGP